MKNDMTTEIPPEWAYNRARELIRGVDAYDAFARYIAEHEPEPEDPLMEEAREIAAKWHDAIGSEMTFLIREGSRDSNYVVQAAFAALKRGIEIGKGEV